MVSPTGLPICYETMLYFIFLQYLWSDFDIFSYKKVKLHIHKVKKNNMQPLKLKISKE